jgi:DNA-binding beta-propeller fold protein YncE
MSIRRLLVVATVLAVCGGALAGAAVRPATVVATINVGRGAGVPAVDASTVWVPLTKLGSIARVDVAGKRVVATIKLGAPPRFTGYLDAAVLAGGSVWVARDVGDEVDRIDPETNKLVARIKVDSRPGGLAAGGGYVWAFHFLGPYLTRIDETTGDKRVFTIDRAAGTGIAVDGGAVWLLTANPSSVIKIDPASGKVLARIPLKPPQPPKHGIVDTWWMAAGGGSLWVAIANYDQAARVDEATAKVKAYVPVPVQIPFGAAVYRGSAWIAGESKVVRIDPAANQVAGVVTLSRSRAVFTQVTAGPSGLWATDYDAGKLYRLRVP